MEGQMRKQTESPSFNNCRGKVKIDFQYKSATRHQATELEPQAS